MDYDKMQTKLMKKSKCKKPTIPTMQCVVAFYNK